MNHGEGADALVLDAREMLAAGQSDEEVFAELAARTGEWAACVLAVCVALGVPRTEAEARLREVEPLFAEFAAGEEELVATLLSFGHVFIVDRVLDEHEEHIRDLLGTAAGARGGYPGGLLGWFRTGELTKIFLYFAKTRFRDGRGSPPDFWAAMTTAGELLASKDGQDQAEVKAGLERCRMQAAAVTGR
ncbi:hypothetical protein AVW11_16925 [Streptomyces amritsarensis]|uniref:Uncharacterized protein n=1 Tax=Streptomyces amritsarensis TaxID=681158 RepID=A0ABX3G268_9ACTN|nr:hypothetical protein [Streptomyces amritsarensis]OLZ65478.1 hypothetical protein AVW11_16925 [Streptomyces amritsarensis]